MMTLNKWGLPNETLIETLENELPPQSTLYYLLISIFFAIAWVVYITYYNSRIVAVILTVVVNKLVKFGHIHIGKYMNCFSAAIMQLLDMYEMDMMYCNL